MALQALLLLGSVRFSRVTTTLFHAAQHLSCVGVTLRTRSLSQQRVRELCLAQGTLPKALLLLFFSKVESGLPSVFLLPVHSWRRRCAMEDCLTGGEKGLVVKCWSVGAMAMNEASMAVTLFPTGTDAGDL